jgi:tyrosyl-tRNA synthetase
VKKRLDSDEGMSFTEFCYQILQGYDFYHLYKEYGCRMQIGGSDQWGNITAGTDLVRKLCGKEVFGMTFPLVCDSNGNKFGKSEGNAVYLDAAKTSYYDFYQFFLRTLDSDVVRYLKIFTFLSDERIAELEKCVETVPEQREAQRVLAEELTRCVHGDKGFGIALKATEVLFGGSMEGLGADDLEKIFSNVPSGTLSRDEVIGQPAFEVIAAAKMTNSKGDARRLVQQGGLSINNVKAAGLEREIALDDLIEDRLMVLRSGKKKYFLLKVEG